ncbi:MAG TPA: hypothetical protein VGM33_09490 [Baekduia sp.]
MSGRPSPLAALRVPGEEDARRRAWAVAQAALAQREPVAKRRARPPLALAAVAVAAIVVLALAVTAPGRATADWVRARIDAVAHPPAPPRAPANPVPSTGPLPGGGLILVVNDHGPTVLGLGAPRVLLGRVDAATWSPHGKYVAAVRGIELIAVDLAGHRRWSLAGHDPIRWPTWAPSGFRVAYVTGTPGRGGRTVRVVAGDGTGDHVLAATGPAPPAWQPATAGERLAYADNAGRVALRDADSGRLIWRTRGGLRPIQLAFSSDGRRLLVLEPDRTLIFNGATGALLAGGRHTTKSTNIAVAYKPGSSTVYALVRRLRGSGDARLVIVHTDRHGVRPVDFSTVLFAGGPLGAPAWSPTGDWLVAEGGAAGWDVLHVAGRGTDRIRLLAPGRGAHLAGWCCG